MECYNCGNPNSMRAECDQLYCSRCEEEAGEFENETALMAFYKDKMTNRVLRFAICERDDDDDEQDWFLVNDPKPGNCDGGFFIGDEECAQWKIEAVHEATQAYATLTGHDVKCYGEEQEGMISIYCEGCDRDKACQGIADLLKFKGHVQVVKPEVEDYSGVDDTDLFNLICETEGDLRTYEADRDNAEDAYSKATANIVYKEGILEDLKKEITRRRTK